MQKSMEFVFYGHSCLAAHFKRGKIIFDPFIKENKLAAHVQFDAVRTDYILLTHGHFDHVADTLELATRNNASLISNPEINSWFKQQGVTQTIPMNIGGKIELPFGSVRMVNAIHSSSLPDGSYGGNPCGYLVQSPEGAFYFAGDTALHYDMKLIGELWKPDTAVLPLGDHFTMGADDAVIAAQFCGVKKVIGVHFDTFPYIAIKKEEVYAKFQRAGIELVLPEIGKPFRI
jgi:L-ascorbate metabolism protein UlaG (beta-lactamase superfamily)